MSYCWKCEDKKEYNRLKMDKLYDEAKEQAGKSKKTMAIVQKSGAVYEVVEANKATGLNVIKYISHAS